jgi:hypothetical protein
MLTSFGTLCFCPLVHGKCHLTGRSFEIAHEMFLAIGAGLRHIEKQALPAVFANWTPRIRQWTEANGSYLDRACKNSMARVSFRRQMSRSSSFSEISDSGYAH